MFVTLLAGSQVSDRCPLGYLLLFLVVVVFLFLFFNIDKLTDRFGLE